MACAFTAHGPRKSMRSLRPRGTRKLSGSRHGQRRASVWVLTAESSRSPHEPWKSRLALPRDILPSFYRRCGPDAYAKPGNSPRHSIRRRQAPTNKATFAERPEPFHPRQQPRRLQPPRLLISVGPLQRVPSPCTVGVPMAKGIPLADTRLSGHRQRPGFSARSGLPRIG